MQNISTGTGIALLAGAIVAYPIIDRAMPRAEASATYVAAVVAAATAQVPPEPTIVWYGISSPAIGNSGGKSPVVVRAWSDGKVEVNEFALAYPCGVFSSCGWMVLSDPNSGYPSASDINFDSKVDGADLSQVLNDWGNAPRQDIPPSTCPLNLINP
jgi:hypothetical protein